MKKNLYLLLLTGIFLLIANLDSFAQQKIWGTGSSSFFNINTDGSAYTEILKDVNIGEPVDGPLTAPDSSLYGSTGSTIFRFKPGALKPTIVYQSTTLSMHLTLLDFENQFIYGRAANKMFRVKLDGSEFTILRDGDITGDSYFSVQLIDNNKFYGLKSGGDFGHGALFRMNADGSDFSVVRSFDVEISTLYKGPDDANSGWCSALAPFGGTVGKGGLYSLNLDGSDFYLFGDFQGTGTQPEFDGLGPLDGEHPVGIVAHPSGFGIFVVTELGGDNNYGGLYNFAADGQEKVHDFTIQDRNPIGPLVIHDHTVYGVTELTFEGSGKIFAYDIQQDEFTTAVEFGHAGSFSYPNSLVLGADNVLYGFTEEGFYQQHKSLFSVNTDGTNLQRQYYFQYAFGPRDIAFQNDMMFGLFKGSHVGTEGAPVASIFSYSENGVTPIHVFTQAEDRQDSTRITAASDGYVYAITNVNYPFQEYNSIVRVQSDGSSSQQITLPPFRSHAPLTETPYGIFGTGFTEGANGVGFIFKTNSAFNGIDIVYSFSTATGDKPHGKVIAGTDGFLYGMTGSGGSSGLGVVFKVRPTGTDYSVIHTFTGTNGSSPYGGLLSDAAGTLYGLTMAGGSSGDGIIFKIAENGSGFVKLLDFQGANGTKPKRELILGNDGSLYGITSTGGANNMGTLFRIATDGTGFTKLKDFDGLVRNNITFSNAPVGEQSYVTVPSDGSTSVPSSPDIEVHPVPDASKYTVQLDTTPAFTGTVVTQILNGTTGKITGLSHSTLYYARVKADISGYYGTVTTFTTASAANDAFVISPADSSIHVAVDDLSITSNPVTGATSYTIEINTSANFTGTSFTETSSTPGERTLTFTGLGHYTTYYTRVKTDLSPNWGPSTIFTTLGIESYVIDPADNETGVGNLQIFQLQPVPGASRYYLVLDFTRSNGITGTQTIDSETPTVGLSGLAYSSVYKTRVRTDVNPNFGPVTTFTTHSSEIDSYVTSPANGATGVPTDVEVRSNIVGEAEFYTIELNTNATFSGTSIVKTSPQPYIFYLTFTGLTPSTTYYSRVKTELSPNWGPTRSFTTAAGINTRVIDPTDNKMDVSVTPIIKILPVAGTTQYTLQVSESINFTTSVLTFTSSGANIQTSPLKYSKTYYTRAKSNLSSGYGLVTQFQTHAANKYAFVSSPVDGATEVATNNLKITANIVYGAQMYTIELNPNSDFSGTSIIRTSATPGQRTITFNGLTAGIKYYSRVKTELYPLYGPTRSFTTFASPTFVIDPVNGKTEVIVSPLIKVQPVPTATQYTLELSLTSDFASPIVFNSASSQFQVTIQYSKTYYTRVKTNNTTYGAVTSFSTHAAEKFSFVSSPANGAVNVGTTNVPITANLVSGATSYTIELNTSPDFTGTSIVRSSAVPNQRTINFPSLAPGTTYYNRTSTNLPSGFGPVRSFTTVGSPPPALSVVDGSPVVKVYPNPFKHDFTTEVQNLGDEKGTIILFDIAGRQLYNGEIGNNDAVQLGGELPQGMYILQVRGRNSNSIHRLIKE